MLLILNSPEAVWIHPSNPGGLLFPVINNSFDCPVWEGERTWQVKPQRENSEGRPACKGVIGRATPICGLRNGDLIFSQEDSGMQSCSLEALVANRKTRQPSAPKPTWNQVTCRASIPFHLPLPPTDLFHLVAQHLTCSKNWIQSLPSWRKR